MKNRARNIGTLLFGLAVIGAWAGVLYFLNDTMSRKQVHAVKHADTATQIAVPVTGRDLESVLGLCQKTGQACHGYALAVATGSLTTTRLLETDDFFCLPDSIQDGDIPASIKHFLAIRPEARDWPASLAVIGSLQSAFPCTAGQFRDETP